jgi:hypothetical protein
MKKKNQSPKSKFIPTHAEKREQKKKKENPANEETRQRNQN